MTRQAEAHQGEAVQENSFDYALALSYAPAAEARTGICAASICTSLELAHDDLNLVCERPYIFDLWKRNQYSIL